MNDTVKDDPLDARDATAQLVRYLDEVYYHTDGKVCWAILTNGRPGACSHTAQPPAQATIMKWILKYCYSQAIW